MFRVSSLAFALSLLGAGSVLAAPITFQGSHDGLLRLRNGRWCRAPPPPLSASPTFHGHLHPGPASTDSRRRSFLSNLGSLDPGRGGFDYDPHSFTLGVTFTLPGSTSGPLLGDVVRARVANANSSGVIKVDFSDTATLFNYVTADGSGSFKLLLDDIQFHPNDAANTLITGTISDATFTPTGNPVYPKSDADPSAVPEPGSLLLLGSGLVVVARRFRRRASK